MLLNNKIRKLDRFSVHVKLTVVCGDHSKKVICLVCVGFVCCRLWRACGGSGLARSCRSCWRILIIAASLLLSQALPPMRSMRSRTSTSHTTWRSTTSATLAVCLKQIQLQFATFSTETMLAQWASLTRFQTHASHSVHPSMTSMVLGFFAYRLPVTTLVKIQAVAWLAAEPHTIMSWGAFGSCQHCLWPICSRMVKSKCLLRLTKCLWPRQGPGRLPPSFAGKHLQVACGSGRLSVWQRLLRCATSWLSSSLSWRASRRSWSKAECIRPQPAFHTMLSFNP